MPHTELPKCLCKGGREKGSREEGNDSTLSEGANTSPILYGWKIPESLGSSLPLALNKIQWSVNLNRIREGECPILATNHVKTSYYSDEYLNSDGLVS